LGAKSGCALAQSADAPGRKVWLRPDERQLVTPALGTDGAPNVELYPPTEGGKRMRVSVDPELCTGCELCVENCPDVFEMADDVAKAKSDDVSDDQADCARSAAEDCPVEAISIDE
jgi:ferredoxin